ncbi:MAG: hypothetical protein ACMUIP_17355 [bacterium]
MGEKTTVVLVPPKRVGRFPPTVEELVVDFKLELKVLVGTEVAAGCEKLKAEGADDVENALPRKAEDWVLVAGTEVVKELTKLVVDDEDVKPVLEVNVEAGEEREPENNVFDDGEEEVGEKEEAKEEVPAGEALKVEENPVEEEVVVLGV